MSQFMAGGLVRSESVEDGRDCRERFKRYSSVMKNVLRFGSALVLGGALAVAASGCGASSPAPSTGGKASDQPSAAASGSVAQEQAAAIASVRKYMEGMGPVSNVTFTATRVPNGDWKVTFHGAYAETSKSSIAIQCNIPVAMGGPKPGSTTRISIYHSGYMMTTANGRSVGNNALYPTIPAGNTLGVDAVAIHCPLVKQAP